MIHHFISVAVVRLTMLLIFFIPGLVIEWIAPISKISARHRAFNFACGAIFMFTDIASSSYVTWVILSLSRHPLISLAASDHHRWVFALSLAFMWVALRDFFYYWLHRWQHSSEWLWAEHALHHSDEDMNVTTALRHHWLENPLNAIFVSAPLVILFRPPLVTIPLAYILMYSVSTFIHCNVRLNSRFFGKFIATPQVHRVHHSSQPEHMDKNFAQFFPVWDVIFGTYYGPKLNEFPQTGLASGEIVRSLRKAAIMPFQTWTEMIRVRTARSDQGWKATIPE
jgi:sterol desaturase/sphingolipid hydroxylase (fatty acid hydroxylase superfamily)